MNKQLHAAETNGSFRSCRAAAANSSGDLAVYRCWSPTTVRLATLVRRRHETVH
jgi:hypothetical protein